MEVLLQIMVILFLARILSETSERFGMPGIIGEIGIGFLFALALKPDDIATLNSSQNLVPYSFRNPHI